MTNFKKNTYKIPPQELTYIYRTFKMDPWKGTFFWKRRFSNSMLVVWVVSLLPQPFLKEKFKLKTSSNYIFLNEINI